MQKAVTSSSSNEQYGSRDDPSERLSGRRNTSRAGARKPEEDKSYLGTDSDDSVGPTLPGKERSRGQRPGPSIPNMEDIELKRGIASPHFLLLLTSQISTKTIQN